MESEDAGRRNGRMVRFAVGAVLLLTPALGLHAATVESLSYSSGALNGDNGGSGFAAGSSWGNFTSTTGTIDVSSPGLSRPDLGYAGTGGMATVTPTSGSTNIYRQLDSSYGAIGTTTYVSLLIQTTNAGTRFFGLSLYSGTTAERLLIGHGTGTTNWGIALGTTVGSTGVNSSDGQVTLLVAEIVAVAGADTVNLFVNPDLTLTRQQNIDAGKMTTFTGLLDVGTWDTLRLGAGFNSGPNTTATGNIDEVHVGTASPFAVAVPEPAALASAASLLLAATLPRRRTA